jgi:hypothetical protein
VRAEETWTFPFGTRRDHNAAGWLGRISNGELLRRASKDFDVFVTVDRNLAFQQSVSNLPLPVIVIHAQSNKLRDLSPHVPKLQQILASSLSRRVHHIGALRLVDDLPAT